LGNDNTNFRHVLAKFGRAGKAQSPSPGGGFRNKPFASRPPRRGILQNRDKSPFAAAYFLLIDEGNLAPRQRGNFEFAVPDGGAQLMNHEEPRAGPALFWQGLFVLLPVFLLAGLGLYSLRQDRLLAEQEARQRATQTVRRLSDGWGEFGDELACYNWLSARSDPQLAGSKAAAAFPEIMVPPTRNDLLERDLTDWLRRDGTAPGPNLGPNFCAFGASGRLEFPRDYPTVPEPPLWLDHLPAPQRAAWAVARAADVPGSSPASVRAAYDKFLAAKPNPEAAANARFALLVLDLKTNSPDAAIARLLDFAQRDAHETGQGNSSVPIATEGGLPLGALALARALELAKPNGLGKSFIDALEAQLRDAPSILLPRLLDRAEALAQASPGVRSALQRLRQSMDASDQLRGRAREVSVRRPFSGAATNFWIGPAGNECLAMLVPVRGFAWSATNQAGSARFYPKSLVERSVRRAIAKSNVEIPAYFTLEVAVEGDRVGLRDSDGLAGRPKTAMLLAQCDAKAAAEPSSGSGLSASLQLYLSDPELLYVAQHRRTLWFVWLITAAAGAAVAGFIASSRAFLRQRRLGELKTNFVSSVSHELRAPVASIRLMAESLERGRIAGAKKQSEYFRFIVQECRRLSSLVENLLDFSRIEQGRREYDFESTDLAALVAETVKLMEPAATERQVRIETLLPPEPSGVMADGNAVQQALINLVDNAIKHSPPNSVVTVALERSSKTPGRALLSVEDRGPGIPASDHARIFERFYRRGSELRRETRGVGIGLSIVKHIVEAHRGRVLVRSAEGRGSRFTMEIPVDDVPVSDAGAKVLEA
jgi:signal transduction histidine kinase